MTRGRFATSLGSAVAVASPIPLPLPSPFPASLPSLAVYRVRESVKAAAPISPDRLLTYPGVAIVVTTDRAAIAAAYAAIDAARAQTREPDEFDARWALRFATATERFVHSASCDARGAAGLLDGRPVTFTNGVALVAFLATRFGPA